MHVFKHALKTFNRQYLVIMRLFNVFCTFSSNYVFFVEQKLLGVHFCGTKTRSTFTRAQSFAICRLNSWLSVYALIIYPRQKHQRFASRTYQHNISEVSVIYIYLSLPAFSLCTASFISGIYTGDFSRRICKIIIRVV